MNYVYITETVADFAQKKGLYVEGCVTAMTSFFKTIDRIQQHNEEIICTKDSILFLFQLQFIKPKISFADVINAQEITE